MVPLTVVAGEKLTKHPAEVLLAERDDAIETLLPDGPHPTLREGVQVGASDRQLDGLYTGGRRMATNCRMNIEHRVAVVDGRLRYPSARQGVGDAGEQRAVAYTSLRRVAMISRIRTRAASPSRITSSASSRNTLYPARASARSLRASASVRPRW